MVKNDDSFFKKHKTVLILIVVVLILVAIPLAIILKETFEPTFDDELVSAVEKGGNTTELLQYVEEYHDAKISYIYSNINLTKSTYDYNLERGLMSQEDYDKKVQELYNGTPVGVTTQNQLLILRNQYIKGEITKKEFLNQLKKYDTRTVK